MKNWPRQNHITEHEIYFFKEKGYFFDYQAYDDSMKTTEETIPLNKHYNNYNTEKPRLDIYAMKQDFDYEYKPSSMYMGFTEIPDYEGLKYIPPLFREKYEISIWKIDDHNSVKVKSTYFTPDVRSIFFLIQIKKYI